MLTDPRKYARDYPQNNTIINNAIKAYTDSTLLPDLYHVLEHCLSRQNDAMINVALQLSPNVQTAQTIWHALNYSINISAQNDLRYIFAIPIVLVIGSNQRVTLSGALNSDKLNHFFMQQQFFQSEYTCNISGSLIDIKQLASIKPSQLYDMRRNLTQELLSLDRLFKQCDIEVYQEGVFLRFLVGTTNEINHKHGLNIDIIQQNLLTLTKYIHQTIDAVNITLFAIPFIPVPLSEAYVVGSKYQNEIACCVAMSNIIHKIRNQNMQPQAYIDTQDTAIRITITTSTDKKLSETSLWQLNTCDDMQEILSIINNLLHDFGVPSQYVNITH